MAGAVLELSDENGEVIERWVSDGSSHVFDRRLIAGKRYTLTEIEAPTGYRKAPPFSFTLPQEGGTFSYSLENEPTRVLIRKLSMSSGGKESEEFVKGAVIRIEDESGTVILRFETGANRMRLPVF